MFSYFGPPFRAATSGWDEQDDKPSSLAPDAVEVLTAVGASSKQPTTVPAWPIEKQASNLSVALLLSPFGKVIVFAPVLPLTRGRHFHQPARRPNEGQQNVLNVDGSSRRKCPWGVVDS
jgi:hypothetical protein